MTNLTQLSEGRDMGKLDTDSRKQNNGDTGGRPVKVLANKTKTEVQRNALHEGEQQEVLGTFANFL